MNVFESSRDTTYTVTDDKGGFLGVVIVSQRPNQPEQRPRWCADVFGLSTHGEADTVEAAAAAIIAALADAATDAGHVPYIARTA